MVTPEIIKTDDGSDTLFIRELGEHYHSTYGAIQESMHVFINAGLRQIVQPQLTLFEVGFGTGLNAWLTISETLKTGQRVYYIAIEKFPLRLELWKALNYPSILPSDDSELFRKIHEAEWNKEQKINDHFTLFKISSDLKDAGYSAFPKFDLVYFDAFSPEKQPELWVGPIFRKISDQCALNAKIVTYCAKGDVRRTLNEVGFITERIPGPPGKREMLRGTKTDSR